MVRAPSGFAEPRRKKSESLVDAAPNDRLLSGGGIVVELILLGFELGCGATGGTALTTWCGYRPDKSDDLDGLQYR